MTDDSINSGDGISDIEQADALYADKKYSEVFKLLKAQDWHHDPEILWRLARCTFYMGRKSEAQQYARHAAEMDDTTFGVRKWAAILFKPFMRRVTDRDINQLNYYVQKTIESCPNLLADTYDLFAEAYVELSELEYRESTKYELSCYAFNLLKKADEISGCTSPKYKLRMIAISERSSSHISLKKHVLSTCRDVIHEFDSSDDPDKINAVESAIRSLGSAYHATFDDTPPIYTLEMEK